MNLLLLLTPFTLLISFIFLFTVRTIRAQLLVGGMFVASTVGISTVVGSTQYWGGPPITQTHDTILSGGFVGFFIALVILELRPNR